MVQIGPGVRMDGETLDQALHVASVAAKQGGLAVKGGMACMVCPHPLSRKLWLSPHTPSLALFCAGDTHPRARAAKETHTLGGT
jgi:hypothetical protein